VAIDRPFAGALVPMRFHGKDLRVRALMIEVRRGLYMDERSGARGPAFDEVRERLGVAPRTIAGASDGIAASRSPRLSNL
jgi:N-formylglutamate amidohydrolase